MKTKIGVVVLIAVTAGVFEYTRPHNAMPSDLRDAVADNGKFDTSLPVFDKNSGNIPEPKAERVEGLSKGRAAGRGPGSPARPVEYFTIPGGEFMMGDDSGNPGFKDAQPVHRVVIRTFDISRAPITVEQYAECVNAGECADLRSVSERCNFGRPGRSQYPMNCVDWNQAARYAAFKGARLPSESEWEYAAKQGLPPGDVAQWMEDNYKSSYKGVPVDGSAFKGRSIDSIADYQSDGRNFRVVRGGPSGEVTARDKRDAGRYYREDIFGPTYTDIGFRIARSR